MHFKKYYLQHYTAQKTAEVSQSMGSLIVSYSVSCHLSAAPVSCNNEISVKVHMCLPDREKSDSK